MRATAEPATASPSDSPQQKKRSRLKLPNAREKPEYVLVPLLFVVVVTVWEVGVDLLQVPAFILPPPSDIAIALQEQLGDPVFWRNFRVTLYEILAGYGLGLAFALALGVAVAQVRLLEKTLLPYVVALQTVPKIALAPLIVIWFGFGITSKIVVAALVCFFPMLINIIEGLKSADQDKIEMMRSLDASSWQIFRMVKFPNALPFVFAGLDLGIIFAILGAIVGEFVGARAGLGYLLLQANYDFNISGLFAILIVLSSLGLLGHGIVRVLQRRFAGWADTGTPPAA